MSDRLANAVIVVVLSVWVGNVVADVLAINGYESRESINTAFTATVGVAFAARAWAKKAENDRDDDDDKAST